MAQQLLVADPFPPLPAARTVGRRDRARLGLLASWLVLFAGTLLLGDHVTSLARLDAAVASGSVTEVRVSPALPAGSSGYGPQTARWREGTHRYVVTVRQVTGRDRGPTGASTVVRRDLAQRLLSEAPGTMRVEREALRLDSEMLGRQVPDWVSGARLALYVATLLLLGYGPSPWRASRWAWFWLMSLFGLQTLGVLAFLVLSGPTPVVAGPRPGRRPLRGGWAFVIALLCAGLGSSAG